jgi:mRNA interferase MazF
MGSRMKMIRRGEIWQVRFDPVEGSEIAKRRPALVLQNDLGNRHASTTIVAAITARVKELPTLVDVEPSERNGLQRSCAVNLSHIRTVSKSRLVARLGRIEEGYMPFIEQAALISLGFQ